MPPFNTVNSASPIAPETNNYVSHKVVLIEKPNFQVLFPLSDNRNRDLYCPNRSLHQSGLLLDRESGGLTLSSALLGLQFPDL